MVVQGTKTWKLNAAFCTRVIFLVPAALCFLAKGYFTSYLALVETMGHFGQNNIPTMQRDVCRDSFCFVAEIPQFPRVIFTFWFKGGLFGIF